MPRSLTTFVVISGPQGYMCMGHSFPEWTNDTTGAFKFRDDAEAQEWLWEKKAYNPAWKFRTFMSEGRGNSRRHREIRR